MPLMKGSDSVLTKLHRIDRWLFICLLLGALVGLGLLLWSTPQVRQLLKSIFWSKIVRRRQHMTPMSDNNSISSTTTQSTSSSSASTTLSPAPPPVPTLSTTSTSSPATIQLPPTQKQPNSIYRLFHPPTPFSVRVRGVVVYALWSHTPII